MANKMSYTGVSRARYTVPAGSTLTIDYKDTKPNYFKVHNHGQTPLYCSTSGFPTSTIYDFKVKANSAKMFNEPYNRTRLYVFNPSTTPINILVFTFNAEFDPTAFALTDLEVEVDTENIQIETVIDGFNGSLPYGTNKIGSVAIDNFPDDYAKAANQKDYTPIITDIKTAVNALIKEGVEAGFYNLYDIYKLIQNQDKTWHTLCEDTATITGITYTVLNGHYFTEIAFMSNDSETDSITLKTVETDDTEHTITIKPGEVLNNIKCCLNSVTVTGNNVPFRMALIYKELG